MLPLSPCGPDSPNKDKYFDKHSLPCHLSCFADRIRTFTYAFRNFNVFCVRGFQKSLFLGKFLIANMKVVILTSSIFYLLGLKMSQNIDTNAKSQPDANPVQVKQEQTINNKQEAEKQNIEKSLIINPQESLKSPAPDSNAANPIIRQRTNHLMEKMD
ncbi:hypothetical protein C8N47_12616 [Mangrovibacterium marinum]|uniref:Uncharacterized protein n=1 Tax=Mangrovibacterium marinum TaxID=1639118 RepID=A0A2T5BXP2_9BACT|nr:hypothetical protein C8N47_12616 [Mangrovibacterium marinum]